MTILTILRDPTVNVLDGEAYTPGKLYVNGLYLCFTLEDEDRHLEDGCNEKQYGTTAIPRGRYPVEVSWSHRFGKLLPAVLDVKGFSGIRIHGGNRAEDSSGCILVGKLRTANGIAQCPDMVKRITQLIQAAEDHGEPVMLEIK